MTRCLRFIYVALFLAAFSQLAAGQTTFNFPIAVGGSPTGFAIVNPNATPTEAIFRLYSFDGQSLGTTTRTVPARGQLSRLDAEIFPIITNQTELGWVQIEAAAGTQAFIIGGNFQTQVDGVTPPPVSTQQIVPLIAGQMRVFGVNPGTSRVVVQIQA